MPLYSGRQTAVLGKDFCDDDRHSRCNAVFTALDPFPKNVGLPPSEMNNPPQQTSSGARRFRPTSAAGFTLIELMIVVAVVAILAAVSYPSYVQYVVRANRAAAQAYMLEVTGLQQRYLLDARAYAADMATLGATVPPNVSSSYTITTAVTAGPPPGFTVTATPVAGGSQARNDTKCGTLTISDTGAKTASGSGGVATCWLK